MPPDDVTDEAADKLEDELLKLLARQSRRVPLPVFLAAALIAWLASYPDWPRPATVAWVIAVALVLALRRWLLGSLPAMKSLAQHRRLRIAAGLSALNGITHGMGLLFFPQTETLQLAIASLLLVGLCAGAVATTAGNRTLFLTYALPVMGALVLTWLLTAAGPGPQPFALSVALILALFGAVLLSLADDAYRLFCESFAIRQQQAGLNRELRVALERAEAASSAKTRFLASASHDLRQPIHTLSLFAASLALRPLDPVARDISRHIDLALEGLATQLDALLDMSKLDAGVVPVTIDTVDLAALADRLAEQYRPIAAAKGLILLCRPEAACVRSDAALLARVVGNLVDNAIKYTVQGGVTLSVCAQAGVALLAVEDSGIGIPAAEQAHVFDEFYQVGNPERDRNKGLGLGLSIVTRMVDLLGLRLEMVSAPGWGTGFYLILPLVAAAPVATTAALPPPAPLSTRHILVVDDEESVRQGMRMLLESMGMRVTLAEGEADAVAAARRDPPDVLVSDFRLRNGQSGLALIGNVRTMLPGVPALLISGDTAPERLREAHAAGLALLHKPVLPAQLRQVLAALSEQQAIQR